MHARAHAVVPYIDDATMLHVGHMGSFKIPSVIRHFCPRACLYIHGPTTPSVSLIMAEIIPPLMMYCSLYRSWNFRLVLSFLAYCKLMSGKLFNLKLRLSDLAESAFQL